MLHYNTLSLHQNLINNEKNNTHGGCFGALYGRCG